MSATPDDEAIQAPPQPPSPLPDEPFFAPTIVDGIDPLPPPKSPDPVSDLFTTLSTRMSDAVRAVRLPAPRLPPLPAIMLFGDSLTEQGSAILEEGGPGWVALLNETYAGKLDLFPRGFSGYNTRCALRILPRVVSALPATAPLRAALIFFGANDACVDGQGQCVPLKEYKQNLRKLVTFVRGIRRNNPVLPILVSPPPVQQDQDTQMPARLTARTSEYAAACVGLAKEMGCPFVDLHSEIMLRIRAEGGELVDEQSALDKYLCDGLHLSSAGNAVVHEAFLDVLCREVPDLAPEKVTRPFPLWTELDFNDLDQSLGHSPLV